jgi:hypothetical protein
MKDKAREYADMLAKQGVQELHNFQAFDMWIANVLERNGLSEMNLLSVTEMEAMLKRIRTSVVEYGVWNETQKFLDVEKIMKNVRRKATQKASVGHQQSIHCFFNKAPPKEPGHPAKKKAKYQEDG